MVFGWPGLGTGRWVSLPPMAGMEAAIELGAPIAGMILAAVGVVAVDGLHSVGEAHVEVFGSPAAAHADFAGGAGGVVDAGERAEAVGGAEDGVHVGRAGAAQLEVDEVGGAEDVEVA